MKGMTRSSKILIFVLVIFLILLSALYILVNAVYVPVADPIVFPGSELVESVFVAQNNEYVKNDALKTVHTFETVPYLVDVPEGTGAKIGTGTVYKIAEGYYAYVSEYTDQYDVQDIIASQFPVALLINYIPESTRVTIHGEDTGYINGFRARYLADQLYVTDGSGVAQAIVLGYTLDMPDGTYHGNHIFISCVTTFMDTNSATTCGQMLSAIIKTVRYDKGADDKLVQAAQKAKEEQEKALEEAEKLREEEAAKQAAEGGDSTLQVVSEGGVKTIEFTVEESYSIYNIRVGWPLQNPNVVIELWNANDQWMSPTSKDDYNAYFTLYDVPAGSQYRIKMKNYEAGGEPALYFPPKESQ